MNLFKKTAADTEKEIREKRPKLSKEKNSVEEAHKDDVFVLEGPEDLGQAKNTMQIRDNVMNAFNRRPGVFPYQGVVTAGLYSDFTKVAKSLSSAGLHKEAMELMAIANTGLSDLDMDEDLFDNASPIASDKNPTPAPIAPVEQKKNNRAHLKELAKAKSNKAKGMFGDIGQAAKALQNTPKDPTPPPMPKAPIADSVQTKAVNIKPVSEVINTPIAPKNEPLIDPAHKKPKLHNKAPTFTNLPPTNPTPTPIFNTPAPKPSAANPAMFNSMPSNVVPNVPPAATPVNPALNTQTNNYGIANGPIAPGTKVNPASVTNYQNKPSIFQKAKGLAGSVGIGGKALNILGKGLGAAGLASSAWSIAQEGPNAANISSAVFSAVPMLVGGSLAAPVAATTLAGTLLYHAFTGSLQESLDEDIKDATEEINDLLDDSDYSQRSRQFLNAMKANLNQIDGAYKSFTLGKGSEDENADAAALMVKASEELASNLNSFAAIAKNEDMSFIRNTLGMGFPSLEKVTKDVTAGINQALEVFKAESDKVTKAVAKATAEHNGKSAAKDVLNQAQAKSEEETVDAAAQTAPSSQANQIAGIQQYLAENGAPDVQVTGKMDSATYDGLQEIANKISSLGITEGSVDKLMQLTYDDLYVLRDKLQNWRNR